MPTSSSKSATRNLTHSYYCEVQSKFTRDTGGEFYIPQEIGELMAKITVNAEKVIAEGKPVTICDPASGSGGLILSVAEEFARAKAVDLIRVTCQDISKAACDMAYINMTLWGIPARIIWGDTLRTTVNGQWENIHWHRVGEPLREQLHALMDLMKTEPAKVAPKPKTSAGERDVDFRTNDAGQQEWVFE
ncbi:N-6 DNA methylase [Cerasicoccus fimbriatus]|uniref:N-6 DNA methylase n=1 Tax=Cerasicoccus fimbriatus TaxID=3014554 RepID=UPI0022B400A6|nr:N-6 DNA methylase [Cerasicoccus sp. TK19100]